jgi:serine-type D-Ala-D-Ala carboxypeptidase/endopeptidase
MRASGPQVFAPNPAALVLAATAFLAVPAQAASVEDLDRVLRQRFEGDRTGACVVAALVEPGQVLKTRYCAKPRVDGGPPLQATFEIGSISKTMTAALVADLINQGRWSLDDPIAKHLPAGTQVPRQGERQILLRDLVTHSAGLPPLPALMKASDPADPYATLTEQQLLDSLALVKLQAPIGSRSSYSNFGMMLVSLAVARAHGGDLEAALRTRLFEPLGMKGAYLRRAPAGQVLTQWHISTGAATTAWTINSSLAGVGMVRATLDDLVAYAQAALKPPATATGAALALTLKPVAHGLGMNWLLVKTPGDTLPLHEGGTGGFSSALLLSPQQQRAVVLLADTSLSDMGNLGDVAFTMLGLRPGPQPPRLATALPAALLAGMPGDYDVAGERVQVRKEGSRLWGQTASRPEFELLHDNRGDLYPSNFSALITPTLEGGRVTRFALRLGGGMLEGVRAGVSIEPTAQNPAWKPWAGTYALLPGLDLRVYESDGKLWVQGTAQPATLATVVGEDHLTVPQAGAVIRFTRNAQGEVTGLTLQQGGNSLPAPKRASPKP